MRRSRPNLSLNCSATRCGVEPTPGAGDTAADRGLEVHEAAAVAHLRRVPDGVLAAIVLSGCVEWLPASELARLVSAAARTLRADGRVMIVSATRDSWSTHAGPITRDLARGHPLDPATWGVLLERAGFGAVHTRRGAERYVVAARRT